MIKTLSRAKLRKKRHLRLREKVLGTKERPRVSVFRSSMNLYVQLVDDTQGSTLCSASTLGKPFKERNLKSSRNVEAARVLAEIFAETLKERNVKTVVFDRSGYRYHGGVKAIADVLRKQGLIP
jgi:large subunit ribosomal protein L18